LQDDELNAVIESIINMIFEELIFDKKKKSITLEEFKPIMIGSNLDKTCTINFSDD